MSGFLSHAPCGTPPGGSGLGIGIGARLCAPTMRHEAYDVGLHLQVIGVFESLGTGPGFLLAYFSRICNIAMNTFGANTTIIMNEITMNNNKLNTMRHEAYGSGMQVQCGHGLN